MVEQLEDTLATEMRNQLRTARFDKKITPTEISSRMGKLNIPKWLRTQIIQMVRYRELDRNTCPIEQAMFGAVCTIIVKELMDNEKK